MTSVASRFSDAPPHSASARYTPVRFGALLQRTHELYWKHFSTFVGLMALPIGASTLLMWAGGALPAAPGSWFAGLAGLVLILLSVWAWAALIWAVAEANAGRAVTITRALGQASALAWGQIVLTVLLVWALFTMFVIAGGMTLLVVIGLLSGLLGSGEPVVPLLLSLVLVGLLGGPLLRWLPRLLFLPQVMVLEHRDGMGAIRRTGELIRGHWWRALTCWLLFALIEALLSLLLRFSPLAQALAQFFVAPLGGIWVTLFYQAVAAAPSPVSHGPRTVSV